MINDISMKIQHLEVSKYMFRNVFVEIFIFIGLITSMKLSKIDLFRSYTVIILSQGKSKAHCFLTLHVIKILKIQLCDKITKLCLL